ncbi:MAG TPA: tetratricopeptide repeat protein [Desulfuromonadales bacterium]|nr:tetratricopeptide repeat protein [Desulfuromonadales bacterium]
MLRWIIVAGSLVMFTAPLGANQLENDPVMYSGYGRELVMRGDYEKGIEHLRRAYLLFPYNVTFKRNLAEGYAVLGDQLFKQKRYDQADENFVKAMELYPDEPTYGLLRGICNYHLKRYDVARYELDQARQKKQDSAEILYYLGLVEYETENRTRAMELWEQALKLSPGRKEIVDLLEKSRRETAVESTMDRGHSSRFDLTYDAGVNISLALSILDVLESAAGQVGAELGYFPQVRVPVAIYKRADFKTVTDSPDWAGGFYDGKIRLPFGSLQEITPVVRGILFHEYAHVVIFDLTRGNCPLWLNEGIAEMFARMQFNRPLPEFARAARSGKLADIRSLEKGFSSLAAADAALAYQQSYALVNYMVTQFGWHRVRQILAGLGDGMVIDAAISTALKDYSLNYDGMVQAWRESVVRELAGK